MQASRNNKHKAPKFLEVKLFIATMTIAVTMGLWNLLSNNAIQINKLTGDAAAAIPAQPPTGLVLDLPPMPTLVPVINIEMPKTSALVPADPVQPANNTAQTTQLRSVAIPTQTIIQQNAPVVQSSVVIVSGGSGTKKSAPVTATHSSKP